MVFALACLAAFVRPLLFSLSRESGGVPLAAPIEDDDCLCGKCRCSVAATPPSSSSSSSGEVHVEVPLPLVLVLLLLKVDDEDEDETVEATLSTLPGALTVLDVAAEDDDVSPLPSPLTDCPGILHGFGHFLRHRSEIEFLLIIFSRKAPSLSSIRLVIRFIEPMKNILQGKTETTGFLFMHYQIVN